MSLPFAWSLWPASPVTSRRAPRRKTRRSRGLKLEPLERRELLAIDFTLPATDNVPENNTDVVELTATVSDNPSAVIIYTLSGGADEGEFAIDTSGATPKLVFNPAPDYENPTDDGGNNTYTVQVTASSEGNDPVEQTITVTVTDVNEDPEITSAGAVNVNENSTNVTMVTATDEDEPEQTITYSISGGADQALFEINGSTGVLTFKTAPDYENPADANDDNVYLVQVAASDGAGGSDVQDLTVTVQPQNDNDPAFTSASTASVAENTTTVITVAATDADEPEQTVTYAITGGADSALFDINSSTGVLTFKTAPDYENPTDSGANNSYVVEVTASDGAGGTTAQTITATVTDVNEDPEITSAGAVNVNENSTNVTTVTATDEDEPEQTITYSITGGDDQALFEINGSTGVLTFKTAPDYENPADANDDNVYLVQVTASDGAGGSDVQDMTVTVQPQNDNDPAFTSASTASVAENTATATTVVATDADEPEQAITYSITGGADSALFDINSSTGVLTFKTAPDYENPTDSGANNSYVVQVTASDGAGGTTAQTITVTVTDVNEDPEITSAGAVNVNENSTNVTTVTATDEDEPEQTITYSITGGDDQALFNLNSSTGALTFKAAPNYEDPSDADENNTYVVAVTASDGSGGTTAQTITVTVTDANEAPVFTSGSTASVAENTATATTVVASDADEPEQTITYSITGGADSALFDINGSTGVLTFKTAPDYENPTDSGANNSYVVQVTASDGAGGTTAQTITVAVTPVNESTPVFTAGATQNLSMAEDGANGAAVGTAAATDADKPGDTLTYSITAGNTNGGFAINASTGAITIANASVLDLDYDDGTSAVATLTVQVSDGVHTATQEVVVSVTAANDAPVLDTTKTFTLPSYSGNAASNEGILLKDLIGDAISDEDSGASEGIAVYEVVNTNGAWQYSTDGTTWTSFGTPSATAARLLAANDTTRIRFLANASYSGTVTDGLKFRGWDMTSGTAGQTASVSTNGGITPFSSQNDAASITISSANAAPTLDAIPNPDPLGKNASQQTVSLTGIGAGNGSSQQLQVTATSGNTTLIPDANLVVTYTSPNATGTLKFTPAADKVGTAVISVKVTDAGANGQFGDADDNSVTRTFTVTVGDASIKGSVILDKNGDGVSEGGLPNVIITLRLKNDDTGTYTDVRSVATGANGSFAFNNLPEGTYAIVETQPNGFRDGAETPGNGGGTAGSDSFTGITLDESTNATGYKFAEGGILVSAMSLRSFMNTVPTMAEHVGASEITIAAASSTDKIEFTPGTTYHTVTITDSSNKTTQHLIEAAVDSVMLDGAGGDVTINGTAGNDTVIVQGTVSTDSATTKLATLKLRNGAHSVSARRAKTLTINGRGGSDSGTIRDSSGNDALTATEDSVSLKSSYTATLNDFTAKVRAVSTTGTDTVKKTGVVDYLFLVPEDQWLPDED